jgi:hypothetical protein
MRPAKIQLVPVVQAVAARSATAKGASVVPTRIVPVSGNGDADFRGFGGQLGERVPDHRPVGRVIELVGFDSSQRTFLHRWLPLTPLQFLYQCS